MGFIIKYVPDSTFYIWLNLEGLPTQIADGLNFFQACLEEKVIVVPGIFFDLNPSRRRDLFDSPCHHCKLPLPPRKPSTRQNVEWCSVPGMLTRDLPQSSDSHTAPGWMSLRWDVTVSRESSRSKYRPAVPPRLV
jgi:hypothetical protein